MSLLFALVVGLAAFASTNTDNFFLLTILFAERRIAPKSIVIGEYIACVIVLAVSAVAVLLKEAVPPHWLALLGIAPLTMGLYRALRLFFNPEDAAQAKSKAYRTSTYSVVLLSLAISGDNIGVYCALFPTLTMWQIATLMLQFLVLLGIWCGGAKFVATHPALSRVLHNTAYAIMPLILIGIGLLILSKLFR